MFGMRNPLYILDVEAETGLPDKLRLWNRIENKELVIKSAVLFISLFNLYESRDGFPALF